MPPYCRCLFLIVIPRLHLTPERQKQKTLEALLDLAAGARQRSSRCCLIMEDLHWVDPSTLEWLSLLIDQVSTARADRSCPFVRIYVRHGPSRAT